MEQYMNEFIIIFLVINLTSLLIKRVFNLQYNGLSCGLFGWSGSTPPDMQKIKILGLMNEYRGRDGCGYYYNNRIEKGINVLNKSSEGEWRMFIAEHPLNAVEGANVFIGHARKSTFGKHDYENTHPFLVNDRLVLAHNGTIPNAWRLLTKYDISHEGINVDSLAMACLFDKVGPSILNEYEGAAAFLIHKKEEPDSLYVYHGASREDKDKEEKEERPLWMLKVKNGIYFSSLWSALHAIRDNRKQEAQLVPYNKLIKVTSGHITKDQFNVERGDINVKPFYTGYTPYIPKVVPKKDEKKAELPAGILSRSGSNTSLSMVNGGNIMPSIWYETIPEKAWDGDRDLVYHHKGRYWKMENKDGSSISIIAQGGINLDKKGYILPPEDKEGEMSYFWMGTYLRSVKDYEKILTDDELREHLNTLNFAFYISSLSKYPVTNLENEAETIPEDFRYRWYKNGIYEKSGYTPRWGNRSYCFRDGILTKITCTNPKETPLLKLPIVERFEDTKAKVDALIEKVLKEEADKKEANNNPFGYDEKVNERMLFFDTIWVDKDCAFNCLKKDKAINTALRNYVKDWYIALEDVELTEEMLDEKISRIIEDAIAGETTLAEFMPLTGVIEEYIQVALDGSTPASDEFVINKQGIYVPISALDVQDNDEDVLPFPLDILSGTNTCLTCSGIGIVPMSGTCKDCDGTGRIKKDASLEKAKEAATTVANLIQPKLFDDPEIDYRKAEDEEKTFDQLVTDRLNKKYSSANELAPDCTITDDREADEMWDTKESKDLIADDVIGYIRDMESLADQLQSKTHSDLGQGAAFALYRGIDEMRAKLKEALIKYNETNLLHELNKQVHSV